MNEKDKEPDYKKIYDFISKEYKKTGFFARGVCDETFFSLRVYEVCKDLNRKIDGNTKENILYTAALLHDIGKTSLDNDKLKDPKSDTFKDEWRLHAEKGVPIAERFLKDEGHSDEFIEEVTHLIRYHDTRKDDMDKSMELKVLQDADLLADSGKVGVARSFMYTGQYGLSFLSNIRFINEAVSRIEDDDVLNLDVSKEIGKRLKEEEKGLAKEFLEYLESDLLD